MVNIVLLMVLCVCWGACIGIVFMGGGLVGLIPAAICALCAGMKAGEIRNGLNRRS
jgi:hypothetical protein